MTKATLGSYFQMEAEAEIQLYLGSHQIELKIKGLADEDVKNLLTHLTSVDLEITEGYGLNRRTGYIDYKLVASNSTGETYEFHTADLEIPGRAGSQQILEHMQALCGETPSFRLR